MELLKRRSSGETQQLEFMGELTCVKFGVDETKALKLTFFDLYLLFVCCKVAE